MAKAKAALPTDYGEAVAKTICDRMAEGESVRSICRDKAMPGKSTVMRWLATHEDFAKAYSIAITLRAEALVEEGLEIIDDGSADYKLAGRDGGDRLIDSEHIQRSKARADYRKWMAARMDPKKYGDRLDMNHGGEVGLKVEVVRFADDQGS